ncbi:MAG: hypothetical protein IPH03_13695 [Tetrasphaera sp.]|nr:hypothetical protein [Tetrasphaera sp.]
MDSLDTRHIARRLGVSTYTVRTTPEIGLQQDRRHQPWTTRGTDRGPLLRSAHPR